MFLTFKPGLMSGFLGCCLGIVNLSMTWQDTEGLLTEEDIHLEESQDAPAISSAPGQSPVWEAYNKWKCFPSDSIELSCVSHFFSNGNKTEEPRTPSILVDLGSEKLEVDYDDFAADCDAVVSEWESLFEDEMFICIYAAHLQDFEAGHSYWLLEQLKTSKGYWVSQRSSQPSWIGNPESEE